MSRSKLERTTQLELKEKRTYLLEAEVWTWVLLQSKLWMVERYPE